MRIYSFFCLFLCLIVLACTREATKKINNGSEQVSASNFISSYTNIQIDESRSFTGPCEPSIAINPSNPNNIVAGSVLDNVYTSDDGGKTWKVDQLKSTVGVYGDPVIRADNQGIFYYSHLSNPTGKAWQDEEFLDRIVIQKSNDGGMTWNDGSFTRPNSPKDQDKQWMAIDPKSHELYMTWTEFDLYDSKDPDDHSRIMFSKSTDEGENWTIPISISEVEGDCLDGDQTTEGAVPAVDNNGNVYVAWCNNEKIYFDKSTDKGNTWMEKDIVVAAQPGGWTYDIPGIMRCNGMTITEVDLSSGPHSGTIYINWSDQRNGINDTDIWISKSTDEGMSWSTPKRVNDDGPGKHQFFTWMDVDPVTGYIYIVFYDRRDDIEDKNETEVYLAYSRDGGENFTNMKISEESFIPKPAVFFGDYNDISAHDGMVRPIWTRQENFKLSVWTALINAK